jgi:Xaa-Pro aminopeptidase
MGTLVVTADAAALFADSRYWEQARARAAGQRHRPREDPHGAATHHIDWLRAAAARRHTWRSTARCWAGRRAATARRAGRAGIVLTTERRPAGRRLARPPALPAAPVYAHLPAAGDRAAPPSWPACARRWRATGARHHFVSTVDDIAWITNLRGADVDYNPVFLAHLLIDAQAPRCSSARARSTRRWRAELAADGIALADYAAAAPRWPRCRRAARAGSTRAASPGSAPAGARGACGGRGHQPEHAAKSRKSDAEAAFVREAMAEDGVAMCEFYAWFEAALARGERITELTIDERLSAERAKMPGFVGLSFSTIAGFNANGAMPHYRATPESHAVIDGDGLLLIDSGGQYLGGTTDITRVWPIGTISAAHEARLHPGAQGHDGLSRARFPRGTLSPMLDAWRARRCGPRASSSATAPATAWATS